MGVRVQKDYIRRSALFHGIVDRLRKTHVKAVFREQNLGKRFIYAIYVIFRSIILYKDLCRKTLE
jgi:uncharacterized membrane protein